MDRTPILLLLTGLLSLSSALAAPTDLGVLSVAEKPAQLIRATSLYEAAAGTRLKASDYLESGSAGLLLDQVAGVRLALGPKTRIYLEQNGNTTHIGLLEGWLKLQPLSGKPSSLRVDTANLMLDASHSASVIHVQGMRTEVFVEDGTLGMVESKGRESRKASLKREEYARRLDDSPLSAAGRPPSAFISTMPAAFFDPLPAVSPRKGAGDTLKKLRDVTFADVSPLLLGPLKSNARSLATRFSPRLSDPAFRQAILQHFGGTLPWEAELYRFERRAGTH
ncbi:hypothetical protein ACYU03_15805 [Pseudomonas sp. X10]